VAVKNNREAPSARIFDRLSVDIVTGVLYVVVGLGILFPLMDYVWWHLLKLDRGVMGWWLLLILADIGLATGLVVVGKRLLDARPIKGLRAGIAVGVLGVFLIALLTVWVGGYVADYVFANGMSPMVGAAITVAFGVAVLVLAGYYFLTPKAEEGLVALEEQGWLSAASYKRAQGVRVRRGTMLGILILAGCGIWVAHQGLAKQGGAWQVGIPFTGQVAINWDTVGDDPELRALLENGPPDRPEKGQKAIHAAWDTRRQEALDSLRQVGHFPPDVKDQLRDLAKDDKDVEKLLKEVVHPGAEEGERVLGSDEQQKVETALRTLRQPEPSAVVLVDRFWLRDHNREVAGDPAKRIPGKFVKVTNPGGDPYQTEQYAPKDDEKYETKTGPNFAQGEVVTREAFEQQRRKRQDKHDQLVDHKDPRIPDPELIVPPTTEDIQPARTEQVEYKSLVLLPHVAYTLPVILAALTLWFAWRCVNVPAFADFLIATEAELNKVSWTTRRRLIQDTIVVLSTVILMAVALFAADFVWSKLLTGIGVLQPPPADTSKAQEQPW
jgi:preprotein translocase SecE subunit